MSLMEYILAEMRMARDHDGNALFVPDAIEKVYKRAVDGCPWHGSGLTRWSQVSSAQLKHWIES